MRVLLDESIPLRLAADFSGHFVSTVRAQSWLGLRNGALLRFAAAAGFDVIVTMDRNVRFQQNLPKLGIAVVVLRRVRNDLDQLRLLMPQIIAAIESIEPGDVVEVSPPRHESIRDGAPVAASF